MYRDDINAIIIEEISAAAQCHDVQPDKAIALAETVERRLRIRVGGCDVRYLRKRDHAARDAAIRRDFNGRNLKELAKRHELSERRIRQIVGVID